MNWEAIKSNCVRAACTKLRDGFTEDSNISLITLHYLLIGKLPEGQGTFHSRVRKEVEDEIVRTIESWDIRKYSQLKNVFPQHFPKNIEGIEFSDKGWILI